MPSESSVRKISVTKKGMNGIRPCICAVRWKILYSHPRVVYILLKRGMT